MPPSESPRSHENEKAIPVKLDSGKERERMRARYRKSGLFVSCE